MEGSKFNRKYGRVAKAAVSAALSGAMLFGGVMPATVALAAGTAKVEISNSTENDVSYYGYRVFNADVKTEDGKTTAVQVTWNNPEGGTALQDAVITFLKDASTSKASESYDAWLTKKGFITEGMSDTDKEKARATASSALNYISEQITNSPGATRKETPTTVTAEGSFANNLAKTIASLTTISFTNAMGTAKTATFNDLDEGYWLFLPAGKDTNANKPDSDAVPMWLFTENGTTQKATQKGQIASLTKYVKDSDDKGALKKFVDEGMGKKVEFELTFSIPQGGEKLSLVDTLPAGMDLVNDSAGVKIEQVAESTNADVTSAYTIKVTKGSEDNQILTIEQTAGTVGTFKVSYAARVNANASKGIAGGFNVNTAQLTYGTGESENKTTPQSASVATYGIELKQLDTAGKALAGAEYTIQNALGEYLQADGTFVTTDADKAYRFTSGSDGLLQSVPLIDSEDVYTIKEVKAPEGYEIDSVAESGIDLKIVATKDSDGKVTAIAVEGVASKFSPKADSDTGIASLEVRNDEKIVLPVTGMTPSQLGTVMGAVLIAAGAVAITARHRRQAE